MESGLSLLNGGLFSGCRHSLAELLTDAVVVFCTACSAECFPLEDFFAAEEEGSVRVLPLVLVFAILPLAMWGNLRRSSLGQAKGSGAVLLTTSLFLSFPAALACASILVCRRVFTLLEPGDLYPVEALSKGWSVVYDSGVLFFIVLDLESLGVVFNPDGLFSIYGSHTGRVAKYPVAAAGDQGILFAGHDVPRC